MPTPSKPPTALILLAAGASRRMGRPKQLLDLNGRPLVRHVAEVAVASQVGPVFAVIGAEADRVGAALDGLPIAIVRNDAWAEGMGSSLRAGVQAALDALPDLERILVGLADQPCIPGSHYRALIDALETGSDGIDAAATDVAARLQPPALFTRRWFPRLLESKGDVGARELLNAGDATIARVPLDAAPDLDTPDDYARFIGNR